MVSGKISHWSLHNCKVHFLELTWPSSLNTGTSTFPGQAQHGLLHVSHWQEACPDPRALTSTLWFYCWIFARSEEKLCCLKHPSRCHWQAVRNTPRPLALLSIYSILISEDWRHSLSFSKKKMLCSSSWWFITLLTEIWRKQPSESSARKTNLQLHLPALGIWQRHWTSVIRPYGLNFLPTPFLAPHFFLWQIMVLVFDLF